MASKALIVEDEQELGELLAAYLAQWGYRADVVASGKTAIERVRAERPDLVLLDLMIPDVDGFEVCQTLKLDRDTNLIPIVMVTGLSDPEDRARGLCVGANQYLCKPFTGAELQSAIADAMDQVEELKRLGISGEVRFRLLSDTHYLEEMNRLLGSLFLFSGLTQTQVKQLITAVRELGSNAIEWGNRKQLDRAVHVTYRIDPNQVTITIRDSGPGFNPDCVPHAASEEDPVGHMDVRSTLGLREGGFGILMSRGLVDDLRYNECGNEVTMVKRFAPRDHLSPDAERGKLVHAE